MIAETHMKFYKPSIIVGSFKGAGFSPLNRDDVSITSLKPSLTYINSPTHLVRTMWEKIQTQLRCKVMVFRLLFRSIISQFQHLRDVWVKRCWDIWYWEVSPGYDVYKKLKRNIQIVNSLTDAHQRTMRSNDTVTKNPEGSNEHKYGKKISSLQVLTDAAVCVLYNESFSSEASIVSTAELSTPESNLSSLILHTIITKKVSNSNKFVTWSCDITRPYPQHGPKPAESCQTEKADRELKAKTNYLSKLPVNKSNSQKSFTVKRNNKRRQKKTNLSSPVENLCIVCHDSFEEEEASGVINTTWIQCDKCSKWIHKDCIPLDFDYNIDFFFRKWGYSIHLPHLHITARIHQLESIEFCLNSILNILYFVYWFATKPKSADCIKT